MESTYRADLNTTTNEGIFVYIGDIKTSLIAHPYQVMRPAVTKDGVRMASHMRSALHRLVRHDNRHHLQ